MRAHTKDLVRHGCIRKFLAGKKYVFRENCPDPRNKSCQRRRKFSMHGSPTRHSCLKRSSPVGGKTSEPILWQAFQLTTLRLNVRSLLRRVFGVTHSFVAFPPIAIIALLLSMLCRVSAAVTGNRYRLFTLLPWLGGSAACSGVGQRSALIALRGPRTFLSLLRPWMEWFTFLTCIAQVELFKQTLHARAF